MKDFSPPTKHPLMFFFPSRISVHDEDRDVSQELILNLIVKKT